MHLTRHNLHHKMTCSLHRTFLIALTSNTMKKQYNINTRVGLFRCTGGFFQENVPQKVCTASWNSLRVHVIIPQKLWKTFDDSLESTFGNIFSFILKNVVLYSRRSDIERVLIYIFELAYRTRSCLRFPTQNT